MIGLRKFLVAFFLTSCLLLTSCAQQAPSRFDGAQQESTSKGATAVVDNSQSGGSFNRYFPDSGNGYDRIYSQEKKGFAQAKLKKDGQEIAILSISDVLNNTITVDKYQSSTDKINGFPAVAQGSTATAVLVGDRYQVKIRSKDSSFSESDREEWLGKFDLRGLSKLK
ncbi:hypothetical protein I4641_03740 [Waterburya agarophytonicola K14]|uniref:Lipoprotein n=1 Tax=Waterburya agarophytonicola KI4 TaxID=2874699 RepID=A0A964BNW1_9CYAN|nr:hypothetical protein [Waterburya agarophytonicola]MCC0176091.1 hypothetical protein [Waterburya agarophytonicola KI4]